MSDQKAHHKKGAEKAKEDLESMLMEGIVDETTVLEITMEEIERKRKIKKKFGNDKPVCKDGVTNLLQFLNKKLSIRAAEPEEQTGKTFNGRKPEKRRRTGMRRRELPLSTNPQVVMSTPPSFPTKTVEMGEPNIMTANVTSYLCLYESDRRIAAVNNEKDWEGGERIDQFTCEKYRQAGR